MGIEVNTSTLVEYKIGDNLKLKITIEMKKPSKMKTALTIKMTFI